MKAWLGIFVRVPNRKKTHSAEDLIKAGYPMVICETSRWESLHALCAIHFRNRSGQSTYTWEGNKFFFLTQEDADLFKTLQLIA
jgi:hypothetical protein